MAYSRPKYPFKCETCGKEIFRTQSDINRGRIRFCGPACQVGEGGSRWNGGKFHRSKGYVFVWAPDHPRASRGHAPEHILIAEKVLGRFLPESALVHHSDENTTNNGNENLVICQDHAYHMLLHQRINAYKACGHASWRKCRFCKEYDAPENLYIHGGSGACHRSCHAEYERQRRLNK